METFSGEIFNDEGPNIDEGNMVIITYGNVCNVSNFQQQANKLRRS